MMKNRVPLPLRQVLAVALAAATLITALAASGALYYVNAYLEDGLYQRPGERSEQIVVVGIDTYALEELGPWPWTRDVMGDILNTLNADEELRPAAIGVDVLYTGETDPEIDAYLAEAASAGNVVVGASVDFNSTLSFTPEGEAYLDPHGVVAVNLPFPALREAAVYGHTNAMYDSDGVLRHHLWSVNGDMLSMPYRLYEMACEAWGVQADFAPELSGQGFWWVDFNGDPGDYYACSAADILYGAYDPEIFADAVVLIGPYDPGLADSFLTAADRAERMYGVEYLANVLNAMLRGAEKCEIADGPQLAALWVLVFLLTLLCLQIRMRRAILAGVLSVLLGVAGAVGAYAAGWVIHPLWLPLGCVLATILSVIAHYVQAYRERRRVIKTFQRYEDPAVIKELLRVGVTDEELKGKTVEIAVLFVDIRGFTPLSERMKPEEVVEILNDYLTLTSGAIKRQGGTLDKFIGDCTMAFWGAPLPCEDKAYRACLAAMEMVQGAKALEMRIQERFGCDVSFGVGVHVGPAVVGNIGAPDRKDYTAIGDTVNTAARLEANAPRGTVYISRAVADRLGERAKVTSLGTTIQLKGKSEGFEILTLDGFVEV